MSNYKVFKGFDKAATALAIAYLVSLLVVFAGLIQGAVFQSIRDFLFATFALCTVISLWGARGVIRQLEADSAIYRYDSIEKKED